MTSWGNVYEPILYEVSLTQLTSKFGEQNRILLTVGGAETGCQFGARTYSRRTLSLHSQIVARMELFKWPERESWDFFLRTSCSTCWKRLITAAFSSGCITARLLLLKTSPDQLVDIVLTQVSNCVSSDGEYFYHNSPPYKSADCTSQQTERFHWLLFCWYRPFGWYEYDLPIVLNIWLNDSPEMLIK